MILEPQQQSTILIVKYSYVVISQETSALAVDIHFQIYGNLNISELQK